MRYIRAKDKIWKYNSKNNSAERPNKEFKCNQVWLNIKDTDIEKYADTIEELCEMFVFRAGEYVIIDEDKDRTFRSNWKCYDSIYGAVWTDKGLIYVAKMNDKGELILL